MLCAIITRKHTYTHALRRARARTSSHPLTTLLLLLRSAGAGSCRRLLGGTHAPTPSSCVRRARTRRHASVLAFAHRIRFDLRRRVCARGVASLARGARRAPRGRLAMWYYSVLTAGPAARRRERRREQFAGERALPEGQGRRQRTQDRRHLKPPGGPQSAPGCGVKTGREAAETTGQGAGFARIRSAPRPAPPAHRSSSARSARSGTRTRRTQAARRGAAARCGAAAWT